MGKPYQGVSPWRPRPPSSLLKKRPVAAYPQAGVSERPVAVGFLGCEPRVRLWGCPAPLKTPAKK